MQFRDKLKLIYVLGRMRRFHYVKNFISESVFRGRNEHHVESTKRKSSTLRADLILFILQPNLSKKIIWKLDFMFSQNLLLAFEMLDDDCLSS